MSDLEAAKAAAKQSFQAIDRDGNGLISRDELRLLLRELDFKEELFQHLFKHSDIDEDGLLSYEEFIDWVFTTEVPLAEASEPEKRLLQLHQSAGRVSSGFSHKRLPIVRELANLVEELPDEAVERVREALDAGLVFRPVSRRHVDLRSLIFKDLPSRDRERILRRFRSACVPPSSRTPGFVVLSDVDDTLLPGSDRLGIAGTDRSHEVDGSLYPGVVAMHTQLRGLLGNHQYSVLLTARPPILCKSLAGKFKQLHGRQNQQLAILPGDGGMAMPINSVSIMRSKYGKIGDAKVARVAEYVQLFHDYVGRFVFLGDDGQADLEAGKVMLAMTGPRLTGPETETGSDAGSECVMFAFVAIHAVCNAAGKYKVPPEQRAETVRDMRARFGPERDPDHGGYHRFFYFTDYADLANQLTDAGWFTSEQRQAVLQAVADDL